MKYKCQYLDSGICFFYDAVRVCCKSAHNGIGMPYLSEYKNYDINDVIKQKEKYKKSLFEGKIPEECEGCVFIEETDTLNEDNSIIYVDIDSFTTCNCRCVYCSVYDSKIVEKPVYPIFKSLFKEKVIKNHEHGYIQFAGGEPTVMKDFEKIIELCMKNGIENYMIHTNGIKFSKSIEKLIKTKNVKLIISLDSATKETYKKVKRVNCFDKVVENMKKYASAQRSCECSVRSKYIIIPDYNDTEEEILKWYDLSLSLGVKMLILDVEMGWFKENNQTITPQMERMVKMIQEKCNKDGIILDYYESLKVWFNNNK